MKTIQKRMGALFVLAFIGIIAVSCEDLGERYDGTAWFCKTGTDSSLTVTFEEGAQKCIVLEVSGFCGLGFGYEVEWTTRNSFKLLWRDKEQVLICYTGVISGDRMSLDVLSCDKVERTYELTRKPINFAGNDVSEGVSRIG